MLIMITFQILILDFIFHNETDGCRASRVMMMSVGCAGWSEVMVTNFFCKSPWLVSYWDQGGVVLFSGASRATRLTNWVVWYDDCLTELE